MDENRLKVDQRGLSAHDLNLKAKIPARVLSLNKIISLSLVCKKGKGKYN